MKQILKILTSEKKKMKRTKLEKMKTKKSEYDWGMYQTIILVLTLIIGFVFTGIITNQIAQPLMSPRLSTFTVTQPLYVQSFDDGPIYYKIFKISYEIEPALFGLMPQILTINLPGKINSSMPFEDIELIGKMRQANPYADVVADEEFRKHEHKNFLSVSDLENKLNIGIFTNGRDVKSFTLNLYFRQKTEIEEISPSSPLHHKWWSKSTVFPEIPIVIEKYPKENSYVRYQGRCFEIGRTVIENKYDIEIREYWFKLPIQIDEKDIVVICDGNFEVNRRWYEGKENQYAVFDVDPNERKVIMEVDEVNCSYVDNYVKLDSLSCRKLFEELGG